MKTLTLPTSCLVKSAPPPSSKNMPPACMPCTFTDHPSSRSVVFKAIGRKSSQFRVSATAVYKVKLVGPEGEENEIQCADDTYILDAAENAGLELPYSCRVGSCATCAGLMVSGSVDQSDGTFLDEEQMEQGYVLTCISYPRSDCVIHTHKEAEVH